MAAAVLFLAGCVLASGLVTLGFLAIQTLHNFPEGPRQ